MTGSKGPGPAPLPPPAAASARPLTVVGGFLGAGKTSLINHLLRDDHGLRLAVIVNDFGAIDLDARILGDSGGMVLGLANGCVCCSAVNGLMAAFDAVLDLSPAPDHVIIEASGVGDPRRIAAFGRGNPDLSLDAIVSVVDGERFIDQAADPLVGDLARAQVSAADIVVVAKADLAAAERLAATGDRVRALAPKAALVIGSGARAALAALTGRLGATSPRSAPAPDPKPDLTGLGHVALRRAGPLERATMEAWARLWAGRVLRAKGVVALAEASDPHLFQLAGSRWSLTPRPDWGWVEPGASVIDVLGLAGLDTGDWAARFGRGLPPR